MLVYSYNLCQTKNGIRLKSHIKIVTGKTITNIVYRLENYFKVKALILQNYIY